MLAEPDRHAGRRLRVTGPELIGVAEITAALSRVLGRKVRRLDASEWLLDKVAAYRGEPRYTMSVFRHYLVDHRQGAFAFGAPTDVVGDVTGRPAERFETAVRSYAARPEARRSATAFGRAVAEFLLAPLWRGYDHAADERALGTSPPRRALHAMDDAAWKADHRDPGGPTGGSAAATSTLPPLRKVPA